MSDFTHTDMFVENARGRFRCVLCSDDASASGWMTREDALLHEDSLAHVHRIRALDSMEPRSSPCASPSQVFAAPRSSPAPMHEAADLFEPITVSSPIHGPALPHDSPRQIYDNWAGQLADTVDEGLFLDPSNDDDLFSLGSATSENNDLESVTGDEPADFEPVEEPPSPSTGPQCFDPYMPPSLEGGKDAWFPWVERPISLFGLFSGFPRSAFSQKDFASIKWLMSHFGVFELPSADKMRKVRDEMTEMFGAETSLVDGKCGNLFAINSIEKIICDEWSNPLVRRHVHTYPENSGARREHAYQGDKWAKEVDAVLSGPMARYNGQDYYVGEVAIADVPSAGSTPVLIERFFTVPASTLGPAHPDDSIHARVQRLRVAATREGSSLETTGIHCTIPLSAFVASHDHLSNVHEFHKIPHPDTFTNPNPWRAKAEGRRVLSVPIFKYCDDTSGNVSKKWNKHNSLLFVLAGLPREHLNLPYNIHFIATSNVASPLEMLEAFAADIRSGNENGWSAWDCVYNEEVLLVPWVLAFEGDNPMQSEISSHIGLAGKCFCRICDVTRGEKTSNSNDPAQSRALEAKRLEDFMTSHTERTTETVLEELGRQLDAVLTDAAPSRVDKRMTDSGVKDTYFLHFFRRLQEVCADAKGRGLNPNEVRKLIAECRRNMPDDLFNPAFTLPGLSPNKDTPVEILHVVLLGFVKYFWRDAVSRLTSVQKTELIARLDSADVSGLGLDRLHGRTLVQYAGSLVGRDFRTILHVAPSVLLGLIPAEAYAAWIALCHLASMIFRPVIEDIEVYVPELEAAIDRFLEATALWNYDWFNKPKFHIILHLPQHVRRFGPGPLYATEAFESFNHVIRLRSIHSNRQAPSVDIARAFSYQHAIRHILSGGWIRDERIPGSPLRQAGPAVLSLRKDPRLLDLMCMDGVLPSTSRVTPRIDHSQPASNWDAIARRRAGSHTAHTGPAHPTRILSGEPLYRPCVSVRLENGDVIRQGTFVLHGSKNSPRIARVQRIALQVQPSVSIPWVVLSPCTKGALHPQYRMPAIQEDSSNLSTVCANELLGAVNTFHDCATHKCTLSKTKVVAQERVRTAARGYEILHAASPGDRILNLAQLRNSSLLDHFRTPNAITDVQSHRRAVIAQAIDSHEKRDREKTAQAQHKAGLAAARAAKKHTVAVATDTAQSTTSRRPGGPATARGARKRTASTAADGAQSAPVSGPSKRARHSNTVSQVHPSTSSSRDHHHPPMGPPPHPQHSEAGRNYSITPEYAPRQDTVQTAQPGTGSTAVFGQVPGSLAVPYISYAPSPALRPIHSQVQYEYGHAPVHQFGAAGWSPPQHNDHGPQWAPPYHNASGPQDLDTSVYTYYSYDWQNVYPR